VPTIADDGPLVVTWRRLADAVSALADPTLVCLGGGAYRWTQSLYAQLRGALAGGIAPVRYTRTFSSRLPCRTDVLALLVEVDTTVSTWGPHGKTTIDRLHELPPAAGVPRTADYSTDTSITSSTGAWPGSSCSAPRRECFSVCRVRRVAPSSPTAGTTLGIGYGCAHCASLKPGASARRVERSGGLRCSSGWPG
jgi:hypothetical protein